MNANNYTVYKHTSPQGKVYIGITSQSVELRWCGGSGYYRNKHFYNSIKKYGWSNFKHDIIASGLSEAEAEDLEKQQIEEYHSTDKRYGYNHSTSPGGKGHKQTAESRDKIRLSKIGPRNPNYGKKMTEEKKAQMIKINTGNKYNVGRKHSEHTKKLRSIAFSGSKNPMYGVRLCGESSGMYGKHHTEASKALMSDTKSKRIVVYDRAGLKLGEYKGLKIIGELYGVTPSCVWRWIKYGATSRRDIVLRYADESEQRIRKAIRSDG